MRWLILILVPYVVVPAVFVAVALPAVAWWQIKTGGDVALIPDGLFGQLTLIASATSLAVWFAGRAGSRRLLRRRRAALLAYLSEPTPTEPRRASAPAAVPDMGRRTGWATSRGRWSSGMRG